MHLNIRKYSRKFQSNQGFTLLEFAMSIIISGIIMTSLMTAYKLSMKTAEKEEQSKMMAVASESLDMYFVLRNRYPCPANPNVAITDINYGRSDCTLPLVRAQITPVPGVPAATSTVCPAPFKDANGDNDCDQIMTGMMPTFVCRNNTIAMTAFCPDEDRVTLTSLSETFRRDPLDSKSDSRLTYVISEPMSEASNNAVNDFRIGDITILDEFGNFTGGNRNDAYYVLIDHGANTCAQIAEARLTVPTAYNEENENCDGDSTFTSALLNLSEENNFRDYFDDRLFFRSGLANIMWQPISVNGAATSSVMALASGNFGIKTHNPTQKLDVNGDALASSHIRSTFICDEDTNVCMYNWAMYYVSCLSGGGVDRAGLYMKSLFVSGNWMYADCQPLTFIPPSGADTCPSGTYLQGVFSNGTLECT